MVFSTLKATTVAFAVTQAVYAHTTFMNLFIDGVEQGPGVCWRMNRNASQADFPIPDIESNDMACGIDGGEGVARVCPVSDGSTLTFKFQSWPDDPTKESLDAGHKGPCAVYLKKVVSAMNDTGVGDGWFKIWDDGYDKSSQQWCTDKMISNGGYMSVKLPAGLVGGAYFVRPELLALHNAVQGDPQFYTGCAQVFIDNPTGTAVPAKTVSIPGYVKKGERAVAYNIYGTPLALPYPIPGPKVTTFEDNGTTTQKTQNEGRKPKGCVDENDNWCAFEVPSYTDETGCWASSKKCWDQSKVCWATALPTGGDGCTRWDGKCNALDDACNNNDFTGPPNAGKDLTPKKSTISDDVKLYPTSIGSSTIAAPSATSEVSSSSEAAQPTTKSSTRASTKPSSTKHSAYTSPSLEVAAASSIQESPSSAKSQTSPASSAHGNAAGTPKAPTTTRKATVSTAKGQSSSPKATNEASSKQAPESTCTEAAVVTVYQTIAATVSGPMPSSPAAVSAAAESGESASERAPASTKVRTLTRTRTQKHKPHTELSSSPTTPVIVWKTATATAWETDIVTIQPSANGGLKAKRHARDFDDPRV